MAIITNPPAESTLTTVTKDDRTPLGLFLPDEGNSARIDARRLRASLILLDSLVGAATTEEEVQSIVGVALAALIDSSPATLDTLNELAAALGDDPNFAQTVATQLGLKIDKAGGAFTGHVDFAAGTAARAPLSIPEGVGPTSPTNGDIWLTAVGLVARISNVTRTLYDPSTLPALTAALAATGTDSTQRSISAAILSAILTNLTVTKASGGAVAGPVSFTPSTLVVLTGGTTAVSFNTRNRWQYELRSGANTFNVTDIPVGGDLELDLLYTAGTLAFSQTINWSIGGAAKSTAIADTGLVLAAGVRYKVTLFNMGGALYGGVL